MTWAKYDALVVDAEERIITSVSFTDHEDKECEANTRLIAAAPELLAALKLCVERHCSLVNSGDCGNWNPETDVEIITARAAIAKAEGQ